MENYELLRILLVLFAILNILWIINAAYDLMVKHKNYKLQNLKYKDIKDWINSKGPKP